jgi:outer membrane lipoprotein
MLRQYRPNGSLTLPLLALLLTGCATSIPPPIREVQSSLTVAQAQRDPAAAIGKSVRWGGAILEVSNLPESTEIIVLARPLTADGEPRSNAETIGRFIAVVSGFVDPAEYPERRSLTVAGNVTEVVVRDVGEYPYHYPLVAAKSLHLWPDASRALYDRPVIYGSGWWGGPPFFGPYYDPFFGPFYRPWYGYW